MITWVKTVPIVGGPPEDAQDHVAKVIASLVTEFAAAYYAAGNP